MKKSKIGERIKYIRKEQGLTQEEFGACIGVKGNTITGYEGGTRTPSDTVLNLICLNFRINQTWLRTGEGEPALIEADSESSLDKLFREFNCTNLEMAFLNAYFGLNEKERFEFCRILVKMFPDGVQKLVGVNPLETLWSEVPPKEPASNALAEAEAAYEKTLDSVRSTRAASALNTTEGTESEGKAENE